MFRSNMFTLAATWIYKQTKQNEKPNQKALKGGCGFQVHTLLQSRDRVSPPPPLEELKLCYGQFWRHFWDVSGRVCTVEFASCLSINTWCRCFALEDGHNVPYAQLSWLVDAFHEGSVCFHSAQVQKKSTLVQKLYSHSMWKYSISRQKNIIFGAHYSHGKHIQCVEAFILIKGSINLKTKRRNMQYCMFWWWELSYNNKLSYNYNNNNNSFNSRYFKCVPNCGITLWLEKSDGTSIMTR